MKEVLRPLGLLGAARRIRDTLRVVGARGRNAPYRRQGALDGLPIPPGRLIIRVTGTPEVEWFLAGGALGAESIRMAMARQGVELGRLAALLDFGCGCGRVLRHWAGLGVRVHGCDSSRPLVRWCRRHLGFGRFESTSLRPPLPYESESFDLVYALSVFTHLPESLQKPWAEELRRVLRPGGHLVLSLHGESYAGELEYEERRRFEEGQLVVRGEGAPGSNAYGAYHPRAYIEGTLAHGFSVREVVPEGAHGNPHQDLVTLRKEGP